VNSGNGLGFAWELDPKLIAYRYGFDTSLAEQGFVYVLHSAWLAFEDFVNDLPAKDGVRTVTCMGTVVTDQLSLRELSMYEGICYLQQYIKFVE
jgi:hypothetical protein